MLYIGQVHGIGVAKEVFVEEGGGEGGEEQEDGGEVGGQQRGDHLSLELYGHENQVCLLILSQEKSEKKPLLLLFLTSEKSLPVPETKI